MWYSEGTVAVTNGGTNVTGTGTSFLTNARVGDGITITGSTALHEVVGVTSNTQLSIRPAYAGTTGSGRTYGISPLLGYDKDLSDSFNQLRLQFGDQLSNLQPWSTASSAQAARTALGASSSGNTLFTSSLSQAQSHLGVQNVAGRGVVGSSGDLMSKGAFGLGADGPYSVPKISDANINLDAGLYRMRGDVPGSFDSDPNFWSAVLAMKGQAGRAHAIGVEYVGARGSRMHVGSRGSEGPFVWQRCVLFSDILGTVSQSDGVPTGAIIERGSNANGRYTKYADGTLICDNSNNAITTNPAAFVGSVTSIDGNKLRIGTWF